MLKSLTVPGTQSWSAQGKPDMPSCPAVFLVHSFLQALLMLQGDERVSCSDTLCMHAVISTVSVVSTASVISGVSCSIKTSVPGKDASKFNYILEAWFGDCEPTDNNKIWSNLKVFFILLQALVKLRV